MSHRFSALFQARVDFFLFRFFLLLAFISLLPFSDKGAYTSQPKINKNTNTQGKVKKKAAAPFHNRVESWRETKES